MLISAELLALACQSNGNLLDAQLLAVLYNPVNICEQILRSIEGVIKADCIELALGCADSAADAAVLVDNCCSAAKAPSGFLLHLLFGEGSAAINKRLRHVGTMTDFLTRGIIEASNNLVLVEIVFIKSFENSLVEAQNLGLPFPSTAVHGDCTLLTGSNCVNRVFGPCVNVSAGEDVGLCCFICKAVCNDSAAASEFDLEPVKQFPPLYGLTDGNNDPVRFHGYGLAFVILGSKLALRVEYGDFIAVDCEEVSAGKTCWVRADNRHLLAIAVLFLGNCPIVRVELLVGNEFLDFVDCDRIIDIAASAFAFAGVRADTSANRWEGVFLLDKLQRLDVTAHRCELDVTLNCDMCRAGTFAGSRTGFNNIDPAGAIVGVVHFRTPLMVIRHG